MSTVSWNTRLAVSFKPSGSSSEIISPINSFEFGLEKNIGIIDSIDAHNLGPSHGNPRYTLSFEVQAVNVAVFRKIINVAVKGAEFTIGLATGNGMPDSWALDSIEFRDCYINSASQSTDNSGGVPVLKISGICLDMSLSDSGNVLTTNHTVGASGNLS